MTGGVFNNTMTLRCQPDSPNYGVFVIARDALKHIIFKIVDGIPKQSDSDLYLISFLLFFWLEPKEPKIQGKHQRSAGFAGPAHKDSDNL